MLLPPVPYFALTVSDTPPNRVVTAILRMILISQYMAVGLVQCVRYILTYAPSVLLGVPVDHVPLKTIDLYQGLILGHP